MASGYNFYEGPITHYTQENGTWTNSTALKWATVDDQQMIVKLRQL